MLISQSRASPQRRAASDPCAPAAREPLRDVEFCATNQSDKNLAISVLLNSNLPLPARSRSRTWCSIIQSISRINLAACPEILPPTVSVSKIWLRTISVRVLISAMFHSVLSLLCNNKQIRRLEGAAMRNCPATAGHLRISAKVGEGLAVRFTGYLMDAHCSNVGKEDLLISHLVIQRDSCPATRDAYRKLGLRILLIFSFRTRLHNLNERD